jgi:hypothetical protein
LRRYSDWNDVFIDGKALSADLVTGQRSQLGGVKAQHNVVPGDAGRDQFLADPSVAAVVLDPYRAAANVDGGGSSRGYGGRRSSPPASPRSDRARDPLSFYAGL